MICTDVGARGIDISGLPYVINVTLPDRSEDYIHRRERPAGGCEWSSKYGVCCVNAVL